MPSLKGTVTDQDLKSAVAWESQAITRYLYFAQKADAEGLGEVAAMFRSVAAIKARHAHRHLDYLEKSSDPAAGKPIGGTGDNLKTAITGETHARTDIYPGMARTARREGFDEIADGFEAHAKAGKSHAVRFQAVLDALKQMVP